MESFVTYILYSEKYDAIYIGYSSSLIQRFYSHNFLATKGYTIRYRPWVVLEVEFYTSKKEAVLREKILKSGKGRAYIWDTIIPKYRALEFISA